MTPRSTQAQDLSDNARTNAAINAIAELKKCRSQVDSLADLTTSQKNRIAYEEKLHYIYLAIGAATSAVVFVVIEIWSTKK